MTRIEERSSIRVGTSWEASTKRRKQKVTPVVPVNKKPTLDEWLKLPIADEGTPFGDMLRQRKRERKKQRPLPPGTGPGISPTNEKKSPGGKVKKHPGAQ